MRLTAEQARAAYAAGSVAVLAGAGTGKTAMLTERYLHHLRGGLGPLEVVAVTFTEKAAAELRGRIRARLRAEGLLPEETGVLLDAAPIGTLHALALRVCREHPLEAGVPPQFEVFDELEQEIWLKDSLLDALNELPPELMRHVPYDLMRDALAALLADPLAAEEALAAAPRDRVALEAVVAEARRDALHALRGTLAPRRRALAPLGEGAGLEHDLRYRAKREALGCLRELLEGPGDPEAVEAALTGLAKLSLKGGSPKAWGADWGAVSEELKALKEEARAALEAGLATLRPGPADEKLLCALDDLRAAYAAVQAHLRQAKARERRLDFADLEVGALRALEHEGVRAYYRERWKAFLVDEFQDTNPTQARLLERLCEGASLTIVGDEKQSIYAFRRADVGVFRGFSARIETDGSGTRVELRESFRGHAALVEALNALSESVLGGLHQPLAAAWPHAPHPGPHVEAHMLGEVPKGGPPARKRALEAEHLAELVAAMVDGGLEVRGRDGGLRPLRYGDIAVLSRTWDPLSEYAAAFTRRGIPSLEAGGGSLLETRVAKDAYALLRFLANPADSLALAAVLRSPFAAADDVALRQLAEGGLREETLWARLARAEDPALRRAAGWLGELLRQRHKAPSRLLAEANRHTGYSAVLAHLPQPERRLADWRGVLALVRSLEHGHEDVFGAVRRLRRLYEARARVARPPVAAGDAVSLITVHGAKGLEWPVVILPNLQRPWRPGGEKVRVDPEHGVSLEFDDGTPALHRALAERAARLAEAEERRILYVAMTRARDRLVLCCTGTRRGSAAEWLTPGLQRLGIDWRPFLPGT